MNRKLKKKKKVSDKHIQMKAQNVFQSRFFLDYLLFINNSIPLDQTTENLKLKHSTSSHS